MYSVLGCKTEMVYDYESYGKFTGEFDSYCEVVATFDTKQLVRDFIKSSVVEGQYKRPSLLGGYHGHKIIPCTTHSLTAPHNPVEVPHV